MASKLDLLAAKSARSCSARIVGPCSHISTLNTALTLNQTPLRDIAPEFGLAVDDIKEPLYDDPSLALIYAQLRDKTLQTVKGSIEISGRFEFNFVLQMARVFCRMGRSTLP